MEKIFKSVIIISFIIFLIGGCAGRDFVRPQPDSLVLGKTTYEDIINQFGKPYMEGTQLKNEIMMKTMSYAWSTAGGSALFEGVTPARAIGFYFLKNILVGHEFTSSYKDDSTYFDDSKITQIKKGETTRDKVISLLHLGNRYGGYIYPLIKVKDEKAIVYLYSQTKGSAFNLKFYQKLLIVTFDKKGVVTDVNFTSSGQK